ncbi:HAMP domain-containing histidine kinase [Proteobacteria bacterium 005FR1]|nr:HAMP domain-containing histidine kinase [Proteobacteria bacterium 005FR1]
MHLGNSLRRLLQNPIFGGTGSDQRGDPDEQVVRGSEKLLRLALRGANAGAWVIDVKDGTTHWNEQLDRLYGFNETQAPSFERWIISLHPEDRRWVVADLETRLYSEATDFEREFRIIHPEKGVRWILNKGSIERDERGGALRIHGIDMDITERKEEQKMLREADRRKDEFLAILAHELRNPLTPLRNNLELLRLLPAGDSQRAEQAMDSMDRQLEHMVLLINDLLDTSRIRHGKLLLRKQRVPIGEAVAQAVEVSENFIRERKNELHLGPLPSDRYVDADLMRLVQVFANLLNNAAKFTGPGGHIWLDVEPGEDWVLVSIKDDGIGISADKLPRLFEMFSQAAPPLERSLGGLGIGLSLVKGLVELHGGTVEVASEGPNRGAAFVVQLPVARPPVGEADTRQRTTGRDIVRRRLCLI